MTPERAPQVRVLRHGTGPRGEVHFSVYQRVAPLLAVDEPGKDLPATLVQPQDVVECAYNVDETGWESIGTVTVERLAGDAAAASPGEADARAGERLELTLAPVRPNPMRGGALVAEVVLPSEEAARLELVDVQGRRVIERDLGAIGAGRHTVDLAAGRRLVPGVYLLRLTQGGRSRVTRVAVIE